MGKEQEFKMQFDKRGKLVIVPRVKGHEKGLYVPLKKDSFFRKMFKI
jgi:hypothetical protein